MSTEFNQVLALLGLTVLAIGLLATALRRTIFTAPMLAMLVGILVGPVTGLLAPSTWYDSNLVLEETARLTVAFGLVEIALRVPLPKLRERERLIAVLLGGVMPLMWVVSAAGAWLLLGLDPWAALLVGAVLTPTDPVVASAIVNGPVARKHVPDALRYGLSAESGSNDGLGLAFVMLPLLVLTGVGHPFSEWVIRVLLWQIAGSVAIGAALGHAAGRLWARAERSRDLDAPTVLMFSLALALAVMGLVGWLEGDGVLAVFVAGLLFDRQLVREAKSEERIQQAVTRFFTVPVFVLLGATLPVHAWAELDWRAWIFPLFVVAFRRIPAVFLLGRLTREVRSFADMLFVGWFGPLGAASIFYAMLATRRADDPYIWTIASLTIATSLVAHGATGAWAAARLGRARRP